MILAFIILAGLLAYTFVVYPAVLSLVGKFGPAAAVQDYTPSVTVLVAAHNEEGHITEKIANTLASDYPGDRLSIIVGSDGSTDGTNDLVAAVTDPRVSLLALETNHGKAATVNAIAERATGDILVISDADVTIDPAAIRTLVSHFQDPRIGAVCGRRSARGGEANTAKGPARLYNYYEAAVKRGEGILGRVLGGDGSLYALRRSCFKPLPEGVPDDFVNILRVLDRGLRAVYENRAVSWEDFSNGDQDEFTRRRRTVARGIRGLLSVRRLLNPFRFPLLGFMLFSHKILRWCAGGLLLALLVLNLLLLDQPVFRGTLAALLALLVGGGVGALGVPGWMGRPFRMARYFIVANAAAAAGILDVLRGRRWTSWTVQRDT